MSERLKKAKEFLLEIFFPKMCLVCGNEDANWVCAPCNTKLQPKSLKSCPICLKTQDSFLCSPCRQKTPLSSLTYCFSYEDKRISRLIHAFKYQNIQELSEFFAQKIFQKISYYPFSQDWIIVPIPLHWQRKNERGYNQAELIACDLSKLLKVPAETMALTRKRYTKTQTQFSKEERSKNLTNSFFVKDPEKVQNKNILLLDDVATTLATLETCATELKNAGAQNIWAVTIARAE